MTHRYYTVVSSADAEAKEQALWDAYYAQRLAELGRPPGSSIDSYPDGSEAPAVTKRYVRAYVAGSQAVIPCDDFVDAQLGLTALQKVAYDDLSAALKTAVDTGTTTDKITAEVKAP